MMQNGRICMLRLKGSLERSKFIHSSFSRPYSSPTATPESQVEKTTLLKSFLRKVPHPVVVLTTAHHPPPSMSPESPSEPPHPLTYRGLTLSSFTSLSIPAPGDTSHPPLVTFNIKTPSRTSEAMHARGQFVIHILQASRKAARIVGARGFAGYSLPKKEESREKKLSREKELEDEIEEGKHEVEIPAEPAPEHRTGFERVKEEIKLSDTHIPLLTEHVLARLHCSTYRVIPIADHEIWVAAVDKLEKVECDKRGKEEWERFGLGLAYCMGEFGRFKRFLYGRTRRDQITAEKQASTQ